MTGTVTVRIDCHVHTDASYDSTTPLSAVLERAATTDLDGLVVTDHDRIDAALRARDLAASYDLLVVPGVELSTADGHLLAIGVTERPERGRSFPASVRAVRAQGGLAVVPHPFQRSRHGASASAILDCDGVETFNALTLTGVRNRQAAQFADANDYARFGGSDAHRADRVGRGHTDVDVPRGRVKVDAVLDAMRAGRTRAGGDRASVSRYVGKLADTARLRRPSLDRS